MKIINKFIELYKNSVLVRYVLVGGISTVVDMATLFLINRYATVIIPNSVERISIATFIGGMTGFIVNYILTLVLAFTSDADRRRGKSLIGFILTLIVSIIGWTIKAPIMNLLVNELQIAEEWIVNVPVSLLILCWNYFGRKFFVFGNFLFKHKH